MAGRSTHASEAVEAWEALLRVHAALTPMLAAEVEAQTGLPLSWYDVLLELRRSDDGHLRMQDLGARVVLSRSRVSRVVDAMVDAGQVEKIPDPDDGRATLARMTPAGASALRRAAPVYLQQIAAHFGERLTDEEVATIRRALRKVLDGVPSAEGGTPSAT